MKLREKIFAASDIREEKVHVSEWDADLLIKGMTGKARAKLLENCMDMKTGTMDFVKMYPQLIIGTVHDPETGDKVFEETDLDLLNEKSGGALEKVAKVAMRLSGLNEEELKQAEKN